MKTTIISTKGLALIVAAIGIVAAICVGSASVRATSDDDPAATYKAKCAMCHGPKAEKKFDASLADDDLVQIVLKGKKAEKPPNMPAYEEKGMTADQAKAMVGYMKSLKQ